MTMSLEKRRLRDDEDGKVIDVIIVGAWISGL
jgi:hypothetical protein